MESQYDDFERRIRKRLLKCKTYKTIQEDPPNKKYFYIKECDSLHGLNVLNDDYVYLDKASEAAIEEIVEEKVAFEKEAEENAADENTIQENTAEENTIQENTAEENTIQENTAEETTTEETTTEEDIAEEFMPLKDIEEEENIEEHEDLIKPMNGLFKDHRRRIDLVLVVKDDASTKSDRLLLDYLTNILRAGVEMEIEPGRMKNHENLYFIKLHASDSILSEYGKMFAVKRHFVDNRLVSNNNYSKRYEMKLLKMIRSNYTTPDGYSMYERSLIVYKILRHLPFGGHVGQFGLHRLMKTKIILDAYSLHDGPYFYNSNTTARNANGRQILYCYWVGLENFFHSQPLHVIHEYFGPKIAFYYAFYGFYNTALALASIAGIVSVLMPCISSNEPDEMKKICNENKDMCPECYTFRCKARPFKDYCIPISLNVHLDHPYVLHFSVFMIFWAILFVMIWRRKEYALNWIWEVGGGDSYYETSKRPEFNIDYKNRRSSIKTGIKYDESGFHKLIRVSLSIIFTPLCLIATVVIMQVCSTVYDRFADLFITKKKSTKMREYLILATFETMYTLFISSLETVFYFLVSYLVDIENHKSYKAYESALISKQFGFSITLIYPFICFYAWLVGNVQIFLGVCMSAERLPTTGLFRTIHDWLKITPWYYFSENLTGDYLFEDVIRSPPCYRYCWPFTCVNEVSVLLIVMIFFKQVVFRVVFNNNTLTTDYNDDTNNSANFSCWEREYTLNEFNEVQLTKQYMILAVQFSLITFFVIAFPLAPLVVLLVNAWDIRHSAKKLLLASRRPLLIRSPGIGAWNGILLFTAYAAIVTNVLTIALTTNQYLREYFQKPLNSTMILDFILFNTSITHPPPSKFEEIYCYAPYHLNRNRKSSFDVWSNLKNVWYTIHILSLKQTFINGCAIVILISVVLCLFKSYRGIEKTKAIENKIKNLYSHYNYALKK